MATNYFRTETSIGGLKLPNRICIHPMEGADSELDGSPGSLTYRRYRRFAESGAALIWFEAVSVCSEGRSNARQLYLTEENAEEFRKLISEMHAISPDVKVICQVTHSGRFNGNCPPALVSRNPYLDGKYPFHKNFPPVSDEYLDAVPEYYEKTVKLAKQVGFDGADIKTCHKYLLSELLGAHTREGKYGGSYENRTRLVRDIFARVKKYADDKFVLATRMSVYDGIEYPYGFGVDEKDYHKPDYTEAVKLLNELGGMGLKLVNVTMGTPYYNPYLNKPHKSEILDGDEAAKLLMEGAARIKKECPDLTVVSTGSTYLKGNAYEVGNGMLERGEVDFVGFGRQAIAYPDFAKDLLAGKPIDAKKSCIACNLCGDLLRAARPVCCVVRDRGALSEARECFYDIKEKKA